ncbi:uncharacterized protein BT62DRAFT_937451 [Guyanagaster necrorhizus]|uniref:Uncharacterized protein n=1 Tax=Guyanagaster necrorhizus TaxID=856835 RepID=A0A9P7VH98_9AGAR|nr:uncharacterized protein BT62DRAFT_937451 [Guyanagaster necrorhizus MCA 3950]KAG7441013.1 hypothetical protein BT62DRAFT_937451 [Guyanagaster necrorhizus MCA 3950]
MLLMLRPVLYNDVKHYRLAIWRNFTRVLSKDDCRSMRSSVYSRSLSDSGPPSRCCISISSYRTVLFRAEGPAFAVLAHSASLFALILLFDLLNPGSVKSHLFEQSLHLWFRPHAMSFLINLINISRPVPASSPGPY